MAGYTVALAGGRLRRPDLEPVPGAVARPPGSSASPTRSRGGAPPGSAPPALLQRTFFHHDWIWPIVFVVIGQVLGRFQWIGMGYFLFRTTSDVERLPFPIAPINAQGATALAEVSAEKESWRWQVFSVGTMIGLVYGFFYVAIPAITSAFLADPVQLIPIPFIDFVSNTENIFPGGRFALNSDLGPIFVGFVVPIPIVVGQLHRLHVRQHDPDADPLSDDPRPAHRAFLRLPPPGEGLRPDSDRHRGELRLLHERGHRHRGGRRGARLRRRVRHADESPGAAGRPAPDATAGPIETCPPGRGDFPIWMAIGAWFFSTTFYVWLCHHLVPKFPLIFFIVAAYVLTPVLSYVSARMFGLAGKSLNTPMMNQLTFIASGYKGVDIWFTPFPLADHGWAAQQFREIELTGTRFRSILKAEAFLILVFVHVLQFRLLVVLLEVQPDPVFPISLRTDLLAHVVLLPVSVGDRDLRSRQEATSCCRPSASR